MKFRLPFMILLMAIVLAGCSFSFGDGEKLEVSEDGVNKVASEKDVGKVTSEVEGDVTEETETEEAGVGKEGTSVFEDKSNATHDCEEDYEDLFEIMPENLAMPECATVTSTSTRDYDHATEQYGEYKVQKSWKQLYELYKEFMENNEYAITEQSKSENGGKIYSKKDLKIFIIEFKEAEDGITRVWLNERTEKPKGE